MGTGILDLPWEGSVLICLWHRIFLAWHSSSDRPWGWGVEQRPASSPMWRGELGTHIQHWQQPCFLGAVLQEWMKDAISAEANFWLQWSIGQIAVTLFLLGLMQLLGNSLPALEIHYDLEPFSSSSFPLKSLTRTWKWMEECLFLPLLQFKC